MYKIKKVLFTTDNFEKAKKKLQKYEWTSDIATDDNENIIGKRNRTKPKKYITTSSESSNEELTSHATINKKIPPRPPQIVKNTLYNKFNIVKAVSAHSSSLSHCQTHFKETSTPVNLIEEVTTNTEKELENESVSNVINNTTVLLKALVFVKQQNRQIIHQNEEILKILKNKERSQGPNFQEPNLPVQLPLKNFEEVTLLHDHINDNENFSELISYLSTLGGHDVTSKTNAILRKILTNEVASHYSFLGSKNQKKAFPTINLNRAVIRAVQIAIPQTSEDDVTVCIKNWLKPSPQRLTLELKKQNNQ
ncbi:uncharacterized protein LOC105259393 [Camponotus floridanus]|uniref:uncharacterized protein LOC105259393 n=1 Tax=Camponotus floridanus TaxID=104421 RepID=UPI000DC67691|nr:uncharacterized protein LOC105259393 [Camponotus floridanus]